MCFLSYVFFVLFIVVFKFGFLVVVFGCVFLRFMILSFYSDFYSLLILLVSLFSFKCIVKRYINKLLLLLLCFLVVF